MAKEKLTQEEMEIRAIRLPKNGEVFGVVEQMLGSDRLKVKCDDGNERICRIPGRIRKRVWLKVGDLVLVSPWSVQGSSRGDIIFKYTPTQANWMKRKGYIKHISIE